VSDQKDPASGQLNDILKLAFMKGASDVHLKTGSVPMVRLHGDLVPLDAHAPRLNGETMVAIARSLMSDVQCRLFDEFKELDLGYGISGVGRFRVNVFMQRGSLRMVFRALKDKIPTLKDLGLPAVVEKIAEGERGLILVTGVTGSGKSTTMASMIDHINRKYRKHIITIEDPIEYLIRDRTSLITQRELGTDTPSFSRALRAALRQDPDVIMIGEMRDTETIHTALQAAETGHLVISTMHTADAQETINRILVHFEPHQQLQIRLQLASVIRAVIAQRLAQKSDRSGSVPAVEIMISNARIRDMIIQPEKTRDIPMAIEEGYVSYGMQSFDQSLMGLLKHRVIDVREAVQLSSRPEDFELRLKGVHSQEDQRWKNFETSQMIESSFREPIDAPIELQTVYKGVEFKGKPASQDRPSIPNSIPKPATPEPNEKTFVTQNQTVRQKPEPILTERTETEPDSELELEITKEKKLPTINNPKVTPLKIPLRPIKKAK